MKCVLAEQVDGVTVVLANRGRLVACERRGEHAAAAHRYRAISASPDTIVRPQARSVRRARTKVGARRGSAKSSQTMSVSPATARGCQAAGKKPGRHARQRHCEERGDEATPLLDRRGPGAIAAGAGAPSRRRVAVRRGGAMRRGRPRRWQLIPDRRSRHLRGRAGPNPVRRPSAKVEVSCAWWSGSVWAAAVAFAVLGTGCAPDAPRAGGDWHARARATASVTGWRESSRRRARAGAARRLSRRGRSSRGARAAPGPRCSRWRWGAPPGAAARSAPGSPRKSRRCPPRSAAAPR